MTSKSQTKRLAVQKPKPAPRTDFGILLHDLAADAGMTLAEAFRAAGINRSSSGGYTTGTAVMGYTRFSRLMVALGVGKRELPRSVRCWIDTNPPIIAGMAKPANDEVRNYLARALAAEIEASRYGIAKATPKR